MGTVPQTVQQLIYQPRVRVFGNDLAPPRQLYITVIPGILALAGAISWMMSNDQGMVLACFVATAVAFFTLWDWLFRRGPTRFSTLMAMALLIGYGTGTLNTWITLPRYSLTLTEVMGLGPGILARGLGAALVSSASLYFLGEIFEKPIFGRDFRFEIDSKMRALVYTCTLGMLVGYATHSLTMGSGPVASGGHISIFGDLLLWFYTPLTAIAVTNFLISPSRRQKVLAGLSSLILLLLFSVMGRRVIIYTAMEILFVAGLAGYRVRGMSFRKLFLLAALCAVMVASALTFMLLRIAAGNIAQTHKSPTLAKQIVVAGKMVNKGGAYTLAGKSTQSNFQTRTFVLAFMANILDASSRMTPAMGRDALSMIELSIPSVIYPDKNSYFSEEALDDQQFGFSYGDEANSILTGGATDFGFFGLIAYPLLVVVFVRLVYDFLARRLKVIPLMFVVLAISYRMLQTEMTINSYLVGVRDSILFSVLLALVMALPRIQLRATP
ncbi:MAG: hypothetical protein WA634_16250 [Silvibacterium sp.]